MDDAMSMEELFLLMLTGSGIMLGIALCAVLLGSGVSWLWCRVFPARRVYPEPPLNETVPQPLRVEVNAKEAFDRATGVFPPFDPRSSQFLQWMRQEWQRAAKDETGTDNPTARHAFFLECARTRLDEIASEGGISRVEADARLQSMRSVLSYVNPSHENAVM